MLFSREAPGQPGQIYLPSISLVLSRVPQMPVKRTDTGVRHVVETCSFNLNGQVLPWPVQSRKEGEKTNSATQEPQSQTQATLAMKTHVYTAMVRRTVAPKFASETNRHCQPMHNAVEASIRPMSMEVPDGKESFREPEFDSPLKQR